MDRSAGLVLRPNLDAVVMRRSGDRVSWSDAVSLPCSRTLLSVGSITPARGADVSGLVDSFRTAVHALALSECPPALLLRHLDQLVSASPRVDRLSLALASFDAPTFELAVSDAGMPAPVVYRPSTDTITSLDASLGAELGIRTHRFRQQVVTVEPGDVVVMVPADHFDARRGPVTPLLAWVRRIAEEAGTAAGLAEVLGNGSGSDVAVAVVRDEHLPVLSLELQENVQMAAARHVVRERLTGWDLPAVVDDVVLIVSELLANALHHAGGGHAGLRVHRRSDALVIEVSDSGAAAPRLGQPGFDDDRGRGMFLIDRLSDRWGYRHVDDGKVVWCELALPR